jgi:hypothetical protein
VSESPKQTRVGRVSGALATGTGGGVLLVAESRLEDVLDALSTRHPAGASERAASMSRALILRMWNKGNKYESPGWCGEFVGGFAGSLLRLNCLNR